MLSRGVFGRLNVAREYANKIRFCGYFLKNKAKLNFDSQDAVPNLTEGYYKDFGGGGFTMMLDYYRSPSEVPAYSLIKYDDEKKKHIEVQQKYDWAEEYSRYYERETYYPLGDI